MIRGTTPQFKFHMPYPKDEWEWVRIKFWQPNNPTDLLPITRTKDDCTTGENEKELLVSLTAEETARFLDKYKAKLQIRAKHWSSGTIFGTNPQLITVYPMSDDIIDEHPFPPPSDENNWVVIDGGKIIES